MLWLALHEPRAGRDAALGLVSSEQVWAELVAAEIQRTTAGWEDEGGEEAADRALLMQRVRDYQFESLSGTPQLADLLVPIDYWRYQTVRDEDEDPEGSAVMKSIERARPHIASDFLQVRRRPYEQGDSTLPCLSGSRCRQAFVV